MINLNFKTKNNSSPTGKPKIFFSAHKEDYSLLDEISKDIFKCQDCAIYYLEQEASISQDEQSDFELQLSQMQMFVFPITPNLLYVENESLNRDFKFAKENKIPILPLMYGNNLDQAFTQKCGDLQYLDKFAVDGSAISFDKKLKDFLSNVLVSSELAEKVRASFDAYVFLSYRKKDRAHANNVMKEIHKNDFARDIAIWFDEFLVPGENFNSAIESALQKSDLFAMVVTPNLINEENYVMSTEYPQAKQQRKKILPIEALPTDSIQLKDSYPDCPNCVKLNNSEALSKELIEHLKNLAIRQNNTPEHDYFIALAYLNGIDVEVNREKGIEILKACSKRNFLPALELLADMYATGNNVEMSPDECLKLRKQIVSLYNSQSDNIQTKTINLAASHEKLAISYSASQSLSKSQKNKEKKKHLEIALQFYLELSKTNQDYFVKILNIYNHLMSICTCEKEFENLKEKASQLLNSNENVENADLKFAKANYFKNLAMFYLRNPSQENFENFKANIETSINLFKEISKEKIEAYAQLLDICIHLGELFQSISAYPLAEKYFLEGIEYGKILASENDMYLVMQGRMHNLLANLYYAYSDWYDKSEFHFLESIACFEKLAETRSKIFAAGAMMSCSTLAALYQMALDDCEKAEEFKLKELEIAEFLLNNTTMINKKYMSSKIREMAEFYNEIGKLDKAKEFYNRL